MPRVTLGGLDEAGRGPVLGPLVVACAITDEEPLLRKLGVRDSKALTPAARERLAPELQRRLVGSCVMAVNAAKLDRLMEEQTLNEIEVFMFAEATITAARNVGLHGLDVLQVDAADANSEAFGAYVRQAIAAADSEFGIREVVAEHKADAKFPAVGAASILAKVERDRLVHAIAEEIGAEIGSGYPSDPVTIRFLRDYISANRDVPPFCRRAWQTTTDLLNEAGLVNTKLEDF